MRRDAIFLRIVTFEPPTRRAFAPNENLAFIDQFSDILELHGALAKNRHRDQRLSGLKLDYFVK
jgi:hypothetical protein